MSDTLSALTNPSWLPSWASSAVSYLKSNSTAAASIAGLGLLTLGGTLMAKKYLSPSSEVGYSEAEISRAAREWGPEIARIAAAYENIRDSSDTKSAQLYEEQNDKMAEMLTTALDLPACIDRDAMLLVLSKFVDFDEFIESPSGTVANKNHQAAGTEMNSGHVAKWEAAKKQIRLRDELRKVGGDLTLWPVS